MAKNEKMLMKNKNTWKNKVKIIGISLDSKLPDLLKHIIYEGWTTIDHYLSAEGSKNPVNQYGVKGVPHVLLVDKNGNVVFKGHPAGRNLEQDIEKLLNDEKLS